MVTVSFGQRAISKYACGSYYVCIPKAIARAAPRYVEVLLQGDGSILLKPMEELDRERPGDTTTAAD